MNIGEYAKAADLLDAASPRSDLAPLRRAGSRDQASLSNDPAIAVVQRYVLTLCDREGSSHYGELLVPQWRDVLTFAAQRSAVLALLGSARQVAGQTLWSRAIGDVAIGHIA